MCGASGVGRSPTPAPPPSGRAAGANYPLAVLRGGAGVGTRHRPHGARSWELALRAVWAARGRPGGAPPAWVWGVRGRALSHSRLPALWAGCRGPLPTGCGSGGVRAWGPVTSPTARALASWLCALWGRHEGARGGRLLPGCGASGVGRSPNLDCPPSGRAAGAHYPLAVGAGGCGRGDLSQTPKRALASWLCALWGWHEHARGGRLLPGCGASGVGRSLTPDCPPSGRAAGAHYPLAMGAGGCGRGDPSPTPHRALFRAGFAGYGGGTRAPGGGAPPACVWGVRCRALPHPRLPALWAACRGPPPTGCWCRGVRALGPVTNPTARALASFLCALWGRHEGARGGAPPAWVWGVRGRALSHPRVPALWTGCRGPLPTGCGSGGVRAWGPITSPTARALASWLCALWGRHEGAQGGCLLPACGASGVGRSPTPDCPPSGRAAGAHYPLAVAAGGCRRGDPSPTPQGALLRAGFARCGGGTRALGGGRLLPGCGATGVGRSPTPDCPPSGRAAGAHYPLAVDAGGCGRGDP